MKVISIQRVILPLNSDYLLNNTKINIKDYLARPKAKFDKEYSEERQKIRKYIREDYRKTKEWETRLIGVIF